MKKLIFVVSLLCFSVFAHAQLNSNAEYIKKNHSTQYENTLKKYALKEWNDDYSMVVWEINKQADALFEITNSFKSNNTQVLFSAVQEWSKDGYKSSNIEKFNKFTVISIENLLKLHCDWSMVKWEYDKQVKAKNAF